MIKYENIVSITPLLDGEQWLLTFENGYEEILNSEKRKGICEKCYFYLMGICAFTVKGNLNAFLNSNSPCHQNGNNIIWIKS